MIGLRGRKRGHVLIVNTDRISYDDTARLIGDAVIHKFKLESGG